MYTINVTEKGIVQYYDIVLRDNNRSLNHTFKDMEPFEIRDYVYNLQEFQLRYYNITVNSPKDADRDVTCYVWDINQRFYHLESSQIRVAIDTFPRTCLSESVYADFWWLNAMTIAFAVISFFLDLQNILETFTIVRKLK